MNKKEKLKAYIISLSATLAAGSVMAEEANIRTDSNQITLNNSEQISMVDNFKDILHNESGIATFSNDFDNEIHMMLNDSELNKLAQTIKALALGNNLSDSNDDLKSESLKLNEYFQSKYPVVFSSLQSATPKTMSVVIPMESVSVTTNVGLAAQIVVSAAVWANVAAVTNVAVAAVAVAIAAVV